MSYYNTTNLVGTELSSQVIAAKTQKESVLKVFEFTNAAITPEDCKDILERITNKVWSINSVRRSITDLTKENKLFKTPQFGIGDWDKKVHKWIIVK